eukprot:TRINITY_DN463_c0_g1_i1.p1 TRINITY_DN463_c0_g1~~TRINITY_DN463_c0_g1_i1.p1  ORF type:complete len:547 (+),score=246.20 TRINITY_DN463_c0_g1_i1:121-1641(+)
MGRGAGQAEAGGKEGVRIVDDPLRQQMETLLASYGDEELDDDTREKLEEELALRQQEAEKTEDQLREEAKRRWKSFHYDPPKVVRDANGVPTGEVKQPTAWTPIVFWSLFVIAIINTVLTLDQWHGNHAWRLPFDLVPADKRPGGWPQKNHDYRFTGAIFGTAGPLFSWVLRPSADKYRCMFAFLLVGAILLFVSFGYDQYELRKAVELPYCKGINDMKTHKFLCEFEEYRATVILDIIGGLMCLGTGLFLLYQSETGLVSRRVVYNEQNGAFEKIIPDPDLPWHHVFPRRLMQLRPAFNLLAGLTALTNGCLLGLSTTQSTGILLQSPGYNGPIHNEGYVLPRNLYVIQSTQQFRNGGWPEHHFLLRLSANTVALVTVAFAIQWRRDGRLTQLCVMLLSIVAGICYITAFALDFAQLVFVRDPNSTCEYEEQNGNRCVYHRYWATILTDAFLGFIFILFNFRNLIVWFKQARRPIETEHVQWGWWCFGEWDAKKIERAQDAAGER